MCNTYKHGQFHAADHTQISHGCRCRLHTHTHTCPGGRSPSGGDDGNDGPGRARISLSATSRGGRCLARSVQAEWAAPPSPGPSPPAPCQCQLILHPQSEPVAGSGVCVSAQRWPVARAPSRHSPASHPAPSPPCRGSGPLCASGASADEKRPGHEPAPGPPDSLAMAATRRRNGCGTRAMCLLAVSTTLLLRCQDPSVLSAAYTPLSAALLLCLTLQFMVALHSSWVEVPGHQHPGSHWCHQHTAQGGRCPSSGTTMPLYLWVSPQGNTFGCLLVLREVIYQISFFCTI